MSYVNTRKIVFVIAHTNFRDEEYFEPKAMLEGAGFEVVTASTFLSSATGKLGGIAEVDVIFSEINVDEYDAIVFIGGGGIIALWDDWRTQALARLFHENEKLVCAICSAPVILARAGLLKGLKATCFPGDEANLRSQSVEYTGRDIEWDSGFLTANGPNAARAFGSAILQTLEAGEYLA